MIDYSKDLLPLTNPSASQRNIKVETGPLDNQHGQIRAVLTDTRVDFENSELEHVVHCMVINLTVHLEKRIITAAEFATPRMAVDNVCDKLPRAADDLVGMALGQGFSAKIKELYEGTNSCFHLYTLLQSIVPYLPQVYSWNKDFRYFDNGLPTKGIPIAMRTMAKYARNTCHAWAAKTGGINEDFKAENYGPILERISPRAAQRWNEYQKSSASTPNDVIVKEG